jgi:hypothetical protein
MCEFVLTGLFSYESRKWQTYPNSQEMTLSPLSISSEVTSTANLRTGEANLRIQCIETLFQPHRQILEIYELRREPQEVLMKSSSWQSKFLLKRADSSLLRIYDLRREPQEVLMKSS